MAAAQSTRKFPPLYFWSALGLIAVLLLWLFQSILLPFVFGMLLAYFLDPLADWMERKGMGRTVAALVALALFTLVALGVLLLLAPLIVNEARAFIESLPDLWRKFNERLVNILERNLDFLGGGNLSAQAASQAGDWARGILGWIMGGGFFVLNLISLLVVTPVTAFYLLRDFDRMVAWVDEQLPREHAPIIRAQAQEMDQVLSGFLRGQATVSLILAVFYATGLVLVGLNYGLVIGVLAGMLAIIPYAGPILSFGLGILIGFAQFGLDWVSLLMVAAVFGGGQVLESYFLTPNLVGDRVGLHPVWVIFAVMAGGVLFGFVGVLLAVPLFAMFGVMARFLIHQYRESRYYQGEAP